MKAILIACLLAVPALQAKPADESLPVVEASGELPSDTRDPLGDTVGGIGSGLVYSADEDLFYCIPDRGPGDGTMPFRPRYVKVRIKQDGKKLEPQVVESILFRDEKGQEMTGLIPNDRDAKFPQMKDGRTCLDPEAIAIAADGTIYITDEYGPLLYQFQKDGKLIRRITLPEEFQPKTADNRVDFSADNPIVSGRNINQGPEGLCLLPDSKSALLGFQTALMQNGGRTGLTTSLLQIDLETGKAIAHYAYPFARMIPETKEEIEPGRLSINDLVTLDATHFLVLERDGAGRDGREEPRRAKFKAVWVIDVSKATNLLTDTANTQPQPVAKALLFNLPAIVKSPEKLSAKWEGIAILPPPPTDGRITLMMTADNDFLTPIVHQNGEEFPFPRTKDAVPSQFFKIRASLPEKP